MSITEEYDVAIVGGGGTGAAAAYDLALRGLKVVLFEQGELTSGTTGRHHGQLHSGARYAMGDKDIARECMAETLILRRIAPECLEYNQGLFLALDDEGESLTETFIAACRTAGIPAEEIPVAQALGMEKRINPAARRAVIVPDGTIDAYRLAMSFFASAKALGASVRHYSRVVGIDVDRGAVAGLRVRDLSAGRDYSVKARAVVNAAGPWADKVAALSGCDVPLTAAAGAMVAVEGRLTDMVVSRLRRPSDGDIVVPQRMLSIIGSTQRKVADPDGLRPTEEEVALLLAQADELLPGFSRQALRAAWCAARPLAGRSAAASRDAGDGRSLSRDIKIIDHGEAASPADAPPAPFAPASADACIARGLFSVVGGKATTLRIMGEMVADRVCGFLGRDEACRTDQRALVPYDQYWRLP
jgi:glycerol-3-phosphate dehydrogenase